MTGMPGVGKTALVQRAAHHAVEQGRFPGGIVWIDLHAYNDRDGPDTDAILARLLQHLNPDAEIPGPGAERADAWRALLARRTAPEHRLLLILDNAADTEQIHTLRPGTPHRMIVTSRKTLPLPSTARVRLDPLSEGDATAMLTTLLRATDPDDDRVDRQPEAAAAIADACAGLPLALWIVAALLLDDPGRTLASLAEDLADETHRLDTVAYDDHDAEGRPLAVRAAFELSHRRLDPEHARAFHLTALDPGPNISTLTAAALLDTTERHTDRVLRELARRHLLDIDDERWSIHDLLRLYATEQAPTDDTPAVARLLHYYCGHARAAVPHLGGPVTAPPQFKTVGKAMAWLDAECANLLAVASHADALGHPGAAVELAACLGMYLVRARRVEAWITLADHGLATARRLDDRAAQQNMHAELGLALRHGRRFPEALEHQQRALDLASELDEPALKAKAWGNLGLIRFATGCHDEAMAAYRRAVAEARESGDRRAQAMSLGNIAIIQRQRGELAEAEATYAGIARIFEELGDTHNLALTRNNTGVVQRQQGRSTEAVRSHREALDIFREHRNRHGKATALDNLGIALGELGRLDEAEDAHRAAHALFLDMDDLEGQADSWQNLGLILRQCRRLDEALAAHGEAARINRELGRTRALARSLDGQARALGEAGRYDEAVHAWRQALVLFRGEDDLFAAAVVLNELGLLSVELADFAAAEQAHEEAADLFTQAGASPQADIALDNARIARQRLELDEEQR